MSDEFTHKRQIFIVSLTIVRTELSLFKVGDILRLQRAREREIGEKGGRCSGELEKCGTRGRRGWRSGVEHGAPPPER